MKIIIDEEVLKKYNLSTEEFMVLYLNYKNFDIEELNCSLINKNIAFKDITDTKKLVLSTNSKDLLSKIITNSNPKIKESSDRYKKLAEDLMAIFPEGKKAGTTYYWRGSITVISERLKKLVAQKNVEFTDEQAINAARRYVQSFNGNYKYMSILMYFIYKNKNSEKEFDSQLLSYIENEAQNDDDYDWTAELK
jgi:hypothetical protein